MLNEMDHDIPPYILERIHIQENMFENQKRRREIVESKVATPESDSGEAKAVRALESDSEEDKLGMNIVDEAASEEGSEEAMAEQEQALDGTRGGNKRTTKKHYKSIKHKYTKKFVTNMHNSKKTTRKQYIKNKSKQ
jgi:hypothetical protein